MKKLLTVFLLFVSFSLFAEKQEIGRLTWDLRDYDNESHYYKGDKYQDFHILFTSTIPEKYLVGEYYSGNKTQSPIETFCNSWKTVITKTNNSVHAKWYYYADDPLGRKVMVDYFLNFSGRLPGIAELVEPIALGMSGFINHNFGKKTLVEPNFDFDHEEMYLMNKSRQDENGVYYYGFIIEYIIYEEI
ncbi:hypothetical protein FACS1894110_23290 [Spirochaetia bacterium]|nr:hypothetical protein FACS1894110_23290 [Spirochaetia bacterium]